MRRLFKRVLLTLAAVLTIGVALVSLGWWYLHPEFERHNSIVYGDRNGHPLVLDVIRPASANGLGVLVMVSGGWRSGAGGSFGSWIAAPLLRHGYTVFPVYHVSQPDATVMEIVQDVERAVRFVRHNASEFKIDPSRLGLTGGSAGGHLSLMLATRAAPANSDAPDPVDRESAAVQAVAVFYPPTDLLNLGKSTENLGDGGPPKSFVKAFGPNSTNRTAWQAIGRDMSPIYHASSNQPPVLIYHGDADTLVPLEQSERFRDAARKCGATVDLRVHHGGKHGWLTMVWDLRTFAAWFDRYLKAKAS